MNPIDILKNLGSLDLNSIKEQAEKAQAEMACVSATGSSGGNIVNVTVNGKFEVTNVHLDPVCVDPRDIKMLEDLIIAAHHDAMDKVRAEIAQKVRPLMGGMPGFNQ